jgi:hypothetical protein
MRRCAGIDFALLGAALFALARGFGATGMTAPSEVRLDATTGEALRRDWAARTGRAPSAADWTRVVDDALDEEALYRAALARGLDRDDPVVQARLIQNMRFLSSGDAGTGALYRSAGDLRMADGDVVVRRRLIERMRSLLQDPALADEPSDDVLQAYLDTHAERFASPPCVRLVQVFLSRQRRGAVLAADAARLLAHLGPADVARAAELGDPLPLPAELPPASAHDLARLFGAAFAAAAMPLEPGRWQGPLASPYGLHLVWLHERLTATRPALEQVRGQVRAAVRDERAAAALRDGVRVLRAAAAAASTGR